MDCVFCRIAAGEIPATIVARTADAIAFRDLNPQAPTHVLVTPVRHLRSVSDADAATMGALMRLAADVAEQVGLGERGYRLVVNTGAHGGQSVDHLHVHLLGGRQMEWPPG
jgi:histidine triad (HIT) family protein